jgi:hypothetical protein
MDGMAQAPLEIVTHNYAPFNAAVAKYIEKLEQPDPRIAGQAFREKARGVGHVVRALGVAALLTLIGASLVVLCQQRSATAPAVNNPSPPPKPPMLPDPPSPPGGPEVVINFTRFNTVRVAEGVDVVTGWKFDKTTDEKPVYQYCYLRRPEEFGTRNIDLAGVSECGALVMQTTSSTFNGYVRDIDYETALSKCRWFPR